MYIYANGIWYLKRLCLDLIVDVYDQNYMKLLDLNEEAQEILKSRFRFPKATFQEVDRNLQINFNSIEKVKISNPIILYINAWDVL